MLYTGTIFQLPNLKFFHIITKSRLPDLAVAHL